MWSAAYAQKGVLEKTPRYSTPGRRASLHGVAVGIPNRTPSMWKNVDKNTNY